MSNRTKAFGMSLLGFTQVFHIRTIFQDKIATMGPFGFCISKMKIKGDVFRHLSSEAALNIFKLVLLKMWVPMLKKVVLFLEAANILVIGEKPFGFKDLVFPRLHFDIFV